MAKFRKITEEDLAPETPESITPRFRKITEDQLVPEAQPVRPRTFTENLARQLGLTARMLPNMWGGATTLTDPLVAGFNKLAGTNLPLPSNATQQLLNKYLPQPESPLEKGVQFLGGALAGSMDPMMVGAQKIASTLAPKGFVPKEATAKQMTAQELREAGYKLSPTQLEGGGFSRTMEGIGGTARTGEFLRTENQELTNKLATRALALPRGTKLSQDVLKNQANELWKEGYEPIQKISSFGVGSKYRQDLMDVMQKYGGSGSFPLTKDNAVEKEITKYLVDETGRPLQRFSGKDALKHISNLRTAAKDAFRNGETDLGNARKEIARAIEDNIELNLRSRNFRNQFPHMVDRFRMSRVGLAKNHAVEEMLIDPSTGVVSAEKAARLYKSGVPLTDELQTIAKAGSPIFSKTTGPSLHGVPPPVNVGDSMLYSGALASAAVGSPLGLVLGALPVARAGARHALALEPVQNIMTKNMMRQGMSPELQRVLAALPAQFGLYND